MGDDHFIKPDNDQAPNSEGLSPDLKSIVQRLLAGPLVGAPLFEEAAGAICRLHFDFRAAKGRAEIYRRNLRHWRDECGKLHAQVATAKDKLIDVLQAHEIEKKVFYETLERALSHFAVMGGDHAACAAQEIEQLMADLRAMRSAC
jgi:hypothetical protein